MFNKVLTVFLGAVLWGLGINFDVVVAIGKLSEVQNSASTYGLISFFAGAILALGLLIRKGFLENKSSTDLWVYIFRGLAVEALLFPVSNLINVYVVYNGWPYEETRGVLIASGLIAAILAGVFVFNAHLLNTKIRHLRSRLEESKQDKETSPKSDQATTVNLDKESIIKGHEE